MKTPRQTLTPAALGFVLTVAAGCGGPAVQFDPAPAPTWVAQTNSDVSAREIRALGAAPATLNLQRDAELATRDAKARIGQLFESQVVARATDWSMAVVADGDTSEHKVTQQSVEVRTAVTVEDTRVEATYRDELTKTHYVLLSVDRSAWSQRLQRRLSDGFTQLEQAVRDARDALEAAKPLTAHRHLIAGSDIGRRIEPDVLVLDLLEEASGARPRLTSLRQELTTVGTALRERHPFAIDVSCPDRDVAQRLAADIEAFLKKRGFRVAADAQGAVHVRATVAQRPVRTEQVANRKEQVHAGSGHIQVTEPTGTEVNELAILLEPDAYEERDSDAKAAAAKALALAADTLAAKFRSAYRGLYAEGR